MWKLAFHWLRLDKASYWLVQKGLSIGLYNTVFPIGSYAIRISFFSAKRDCISSFKTRQPIGSYKRRPPIQCLLLCSQCGFGTGEETTRGERTRRERRTTTSEQTLRCVCLSVCECVCVCPLYFCGLFFFFSIFRIVSHGLLLNTYLCVQRKEERH